MKLRTLGVLILLCCWVVLVNAQTRAIKVVKFEVDGKEISGDFKLSLTVDSKTVELAKNGNSFVVPSDLRAEAVDVRFSAGSYELNFEAVPIAKFETEWVFGVDTNPYDEENTSIETPPDPPGVELAGIHYLKFVPKQGAATRQITKVFK